MTLQDNGVEPANPYYPDNAFSSNPLTFQMDIRPIVAHWQGEQDYTAHRRRLELRRLRA